MKKNFFDDPQAKGHEIYQLLGAVTEVVRNRKAYRLLDQDPLDRIQELLMDYAEVCSSKTIDEAFGRRN